MENDQRLVFDCICMNREHALADLDGIKLPSTTLEIGLKDAL